MQEREREFAIKDALSALQREYQARAEPLVRELADIEARKPSRPVVLRDDGRAFVYVGPHP
jgi:hypothetical protein